MLLYVYIGCLLFKSISAGDSILGLLTRLKGLVFMELRYSWHYWSDIRKEDIFLRLIHFVGNLPF